MSLRGMDLRMTVAEQLSRNGMLRGKGRAIESTPWSQEKLDKYGRGEMLRTGQNAIPTSLELKRRATDVFESGRFFVPAFHDVSVFTPIGIELAYRRVNWQEPESIDELAKSVDHYFTEQIVPAAHELQLSNGQLYDLAGIAIDVPDVSENEKLSAFKILPSVLRRLGEMKMGSLSAQIVPLFRGVMENGVYSTRALSTLPEALRAGFIGEQLFSLYGLIDMTRNYHVVNVRPAKEAAENILSELHSI